MNKLKFVNFRKRIGIKGHIFDCEKVHKWVKNTQQKLRQFPNAFRFAHTLVCKVCETGSMRFENYIYLFTATLQFPNLHIFCIIFV